MKISTSEVTGAPTDLVVYYNPPPKVIDKRLFEIFNRNSNNSVIIGDLNSPHSSFGSRITTDSGIGLEDILAQENHIWLNDPNSHQNEVSLMFGIGYSHVNICRMSVEYLTTM